MVGTQLLRGLRGPRRSRHTVPAHQLAALSLPIGDDGVVVGGDAEGRPQLLALHHPAPFDIVFVGGLWTAQVLALRAAGTGARVAVETGRPQQWANLVRAAGGGLECMTVHGVGQVPPLGATVGSPVLVIRDCGMRPPRGRVASAPWQSVLTLLPYLSPVAPRLIRGAALVGVQRISPDEAQQVGEVMSLPPAEVEALSTLAEGVTLWCTRRDRHYSVTTPTDAESGLLGNARRLD
ncbi:hypothetical protein [Streptomyces oceani]|uniref:Uncharacterized protein n=1 Tax=Streptomyces oceani TaxID=1075402 RepID=A0A1E7JTU7_9ACTN|nr:hypothetical protein [Streptomyces oceani]OEU92329.1 hypothetical protein AN216_24740 [Streptomyces oceani]